MQNLNAVQTVFLSKLCFLFGGYVMDTYETTDERTVFVITEAKTHVVYHVSFNIYEDMGCKNWAKVHDIFNMSNGENITGKEAQKRIDKVKEKGGAKFGVSFMYLFNEVKPFEYL